MRIYQNLLASVLSLAIIFVTTPTSFQLQSDTSIIGLVLKKLKQICLQSTQTNQERIKMDSFNLNSQQQEQQQSNHHAHYDSKHHLLFFDDDPHDTGELHEKGREFYTYMRTHVIYFVTFIILYTLACLLISYFSKRSDEFRHDINEYRTYKISTWMCASTLAISIAAFLLLPVSITMNEITWIDDTRTKWFLLHGMWSYVFLFSNLSLFVLLPFAYFFTESEGFSGSRGGLLSRLRETCVLLMIVAIIVFGLTYTVCCLFIGFGCHVSGLQLLTIWQYLPFLYSCISFIGALLLLLCTPLGISHLFTVLSQIDTIQQARKLSYTALILLISLTGYSMIMVLINTIQLLVGFRSLPLSALSLAQRAQLDDLSLDDMIEIGSNPVSSDKRNGLVGAFLDIVMVFYLWCASLCGLYNLPRLCCLRPRRRNSSFNQVIGNCTILCLLSSALPLLARTLGMTNFDLLGDFGRIEWLGNFYVVLLYNVVFLVSTTLCLMGKRELVLTINLFKAIIGNPHQAKLNGQQDRKRNYEDNPEAASNALADDKTEPEDVANSISDRTKSENLLASLETSKEKSE